MAFDTVIRPKGGKEKAGRRRPAQEFDSRSFLFERSDRSVAPQSAPNLPINDRRAARLRTARRHSWNAGQAAFWSMTLAFESATPILICRGFIASGTSRTRSTCRSPFSRLAPATLMCSASSKRRSKARPAMPR